MVPGLGVRHQTAAPEDLPELADLTHHVGRRERDIELEPARLDPLDEILATDLVGAGAECFLRLLALGEHRDPDDLAGAMRQDDRPTDHLVGVARIDPEPEMGLDGRVEGDGTGLAGELDRRDRRVDLVAVDELRRLEIFLAVLRHVVRSSCRPV